MLSVTHRKVHKQLALKDERNIGQKHIAVGYIPMAKKCLSLQEKISRYTCASNPEKRNPILST